MFRAKQLFDFIITSETTINTIFKKVKLNLKRLRSGAKKILKKKNPSFKL